VPATDAAIHRAVDTAVGEPQRACEESPVERAVGAAHQEVTTMALRTMFVLSAAVLAFAGAAVPNGSAWTSATVVRVQAKDFSFVLSTKSVKRGRVTFVISNVGHAPHDFAIAGHRSKTIGPGRTTRLTLTLKPGRYPYRCTVDSHAELGMKGVLRVRR
jgi:plastocyanin